MESIKGVFIGLSCVLLKWIKDKSVVTWFWMNEHVKNTGENQSIYV